MSPRTNCGKTSPTTASSESTFPKSSAAAGGPAWPNWQSSAKRPLPTGAPFYCCWCPARSRVSCWPDTALLSNGGIGCRAWHPATRRSFFSRSPNQMRDRTPERSPRAQCETAATSCSTAPSTTSPVSMRPEHWSWWPAPHRRSCRCSWFPPMPPGLVAHRLPVGINLPEKQFTVHFDDVRLPASSLIGTEHEGSGRSSTD